MNLIKAFNNNKIINLMYLLRYQYTLQLHFKILVPVGEGRSNGQLVVSERSRCSSTSYITHTHCGFANSIYAKNVSMSAGQMLKFTYHIAFTPLRVYSILQCLDRLLNKMVTTSFSPSYIQKRKFAYTFVCVFFTESKTFFVGMWTAWSFLGIGEVW